VREKAAAESLGPRPDIKGRACGPEPESAIDHGKAPRHGAGPADAASCGYEPPWPPSLPGGRPPAGGDPPIGVGEFGECCVGVAGLWVGLWGGLWLLPAAGMLGRGAGGGGAAGRGAGGGAGAGLGAGAAMGFGAGGAIGLGAGGAMGFGAGGAAGLATGAAVGLATGLGAAAFGLAALRGLAFALTFALALAFAFLAAGFLRALFFATTRFFFRAAAVFFVFFAFLAFDFFVFDFAFFAMIVLPIVSAQTSARLSVRLKHPCPADFCGADLCGQRRCRASPSVHSPPRWSRRRQLAAAPWAPWRHAIRRAPPVATALVT
jgi:hypothetical protein